MVKLKIVNLDLPEKKKRIFIKNVFFYQYIEKI